LSFFSVSGQFFEPACIIFSLHRDKQEEEVGESRSKQFDPSYFIQSTYYVTSNVSGDDFYGVAPYYSQQTTDGNIWVASIILMQNRKTTLGSYIQISCGHKQYRDLIPWIAIDRLGSESWFVRNYNWQYFRVGSAFEKVGKQLCDRAASDRGVYSAW
jgi:hypothetical protein